MDSQNNDSQRFDGLVNVKHRNTGAALKIRELKQEHPNLSYQEIAKLTDCSKQNVGYVLSKWRIEQKELEEFKENRADLMAGLQMKILKSIDYEEIKKAPIQVRMMGYGILFDKERIERGQVSNISVNLMADLADLRSKLYGPNTP